MAEHFIRVDGWGDSFTGKLHYELQVAKIGSITDGVSLRHGSQLGPWVVRLADLKQLIVEVEAARGGAEVQLKWRPVTEAETAAELEATKQAAPGRHLGQCGQ